MERFKRKYANFVNFYKFSLNWCAFSLLKLFGMSPFSYKITQIDQISNKTLVSVIGFLYNVFYLGLLILMNYLGIRTMFEGGYEKFYLKNWAFSFILDLILSSSVTLISIIMCALQKRTRSISNNMRKICEISMMINQSPGSSENIYLLNFILMCFASLVMRIMTTVLTENDIKIDNIIYDLAVSFDVLLVSYVLLQYSVILDLIKHYFKFLNDNLCQILRQTIWARKTESIHETNLISKFNQLMLLHDLLSRVSKKLSSYYSLSVLLCAFNIFAMTLLSVFIASSELLILNQPLVIHNFFDLYYSGMMVLSLIILSISVTNTEQKVKFITVTLTM